jgi:hypothetical protein
MTQLDKRRRQIFINWRLQGLLILFSVVILGCSMGYIYMATSRVMKILSDPSISQSMPPAGDEYYLFVAELRGYLDRIFLSVMGVALAVTIGGMMIFLEQDRRPGLPHDQVPEREPARKSRRSASSERRFFRRTRFGDQQLPAQALRSRDVS